MKIEYIYDSWEDIYKKLLENIPKGNYYDCRSEIVPSKDVSYIQVTTTNINVIHYVHISREDGTVSNLTFVPESETYCLKVKLSKGLNSIGVATSNTDKASLTLTATYFALMLDSYAKELYESTSRMDSINKDVYINEATRLASPVLGDFKNLTDVHTLRTFALQLIVRALINTPGTMVSLENVCKALFISTPILTDIEQYKNFDSALPFYAGQEYELGKLITLWVRNPGLIRRLYGLYLNVNSGTETIYADSSTVSTNEGTNEYKDSDDPLYPEDIGDDTNSGSGDGTMTIEIEVSMLLPRTDRNLPIPFTPKHPWCDRVFKDREHLDSGTPLDVAIVDDPFETGMLYKQCIPYKYDGSKASLINKIIQTSIITTGTITMKKPENTSGFKILTEAQNHIATEHSDSNYGLLIIEN